MLAATSLKAGSRPDVSGSCHSPPCLKAGALWPPKVESSKEGVDNTFCASRPKAVEAA
jgi:hypothetical protein